MIASRLPNKSRLHGFGVGTRGSGRKGIRTLEPLAGLHAFQASRFNHSRTLPLPVTLTGLKLQALAVPVFTKRGNRYGECGIRTHGPSFDGR